MSGSVALGWGSFVPPEVVSNADLARLLETSADEIHAATGVRERRRAAAGQATSALGVEAATAALAAAGLAAADVDLIVFATMTPDIAFPGPGCFLQHLLGCETVGALDIRAQCAGFLFGLATADRFVRAGKARRLLLCGADVHSAGLDYSPRGRAVTPRFGDGAGAVVLGPGGSGGPGGPADAPGVLATVLHSDPAGYERFWCEYPASRHYPARMNREAFDAGLHYMALDAEALAAQAETALVSVAEEALAAAGIGIDAVRHTVVHYVEPSVAWRAADRLGLRTDAVGVPAEVVGHVASAGIPIALTNAVEAGRVGSGDVVLLSAFGAGMSWGAAVVRL